MYLCKAKQKILPDFDLKINYLFFQVLESIDLESPCDHPENELFLYAILTEKPEMAKIFLKMGRVFLNF